MPPFPNEYEPDNTNAKELTEYAAQLLAAMVRAWITVKLRRMEVRAAGVTHGNRQTLLERLTRYNSNDITVKLQREKNNTYDRNAVQVIAAVKGKGSALLGYLNRQLAAAARIFISASLSVCSVIMSFARK